MKINAGLQKESESVNTPKKRSGVVIATNLKRERIVLDSNGNQIDLRTKQIIRRAEE